MRDSTYGSIRNRFRKTLSLLTAGILMLTSVASVAWAEQAGSTNTGAGTGANTNITADAGAGASAAYEKLLSGQRVKKERPYTVPAKPTVYLTFDDGPSKLTGQVLDILKQEQVKATFFVVGQMAEERKELVRRMAQEGHAVGNHTYNHIYKELYGGFGAFWEQVKKTDLVLEELTGSKPFLLRAPGGTAANFDAFYYYYLEEAGYSVFDWNVDTRDAVRKGVKASEILDEVRRSPLKHELTVLMHDGVGHEETVKALPDIIAYYREKGYDFAAIGEEVTPVQFTLSPSKWPRSYTLAGFRTMAAEAAASGSERGTQLAEDLKSEHRLEDQGKTAIVESAEALESAKEHNAAAVELPVQVVQEPAPAALGLPGLPLTVFVGNGGVWKLEPEQYDFEHNRLVVPVRAMAERLGGHVDWDEDRRVAMIRLGTSYVEVDPIRRVIRESRLGHTAVTRYLADVALEQGELRMPLRLTAQLLGGRVTGYELGSGMRSVAISIQDEPLWAVRTPSIVLHARIGIPKSHV